MASPAIPLQASSTQKHASAVIAPLVRTLLLVPVMGSFVALIAWSTWDRLTHGPEPLRRQVQNALAMSVEWNGVRRGNPFHHEIQNAKFRDAEHRSFLFSARTIHCETAHEKNVVTVHSATVNRTQLGRILQLTHDRLCQQPWLLDREWHIEIPSFQLSDPHLESHQGGATMQILPCNGSPTVRLQAALSGPSAERGIIATLQRIERNGTMASEIDVDATSHPLPRALFCRGRPWEAALQANSEFQGNGWIDVADGIWETDWVGTLGPVDLAPLGRLCFHESITGSAQLRIVQSLFQNGELQRLDCFATCDRGTISGRALEAMAKHSGLRLGNAIDRTGNWRDRTYEYDQFAMRLIARPHQWTVAAVDAESPAIMKAGNATLLQAADRIEGGNAAQFERLFGSHRRQRPLDEPLDEPTGSKTTDGRR